MKKPKFYEDKYSMIDLLDLLDYIDSKVEGFKEKVWKDLCCYSNLSNDICMEIDFYNWMETDNEIIKNGIRVMIEEFPEIKNGKIIYDVCW